MKTRPPHPDPSPEASPASRSLAGAAGVRRETYRKLIHVASVVIPVAVWVLSRPASLALLGAVVALAFAVEAARSRSRWARYHFLRRTRTLLRTHERRGLAGATWMAAAYFLAVLAYPLPVAVAAMLYNGLGDAAAALVGRRWGRVRASWGKSLEGLSAGFATNLAVGLLLPGIGAVAALVGATVAALLEFLPLPLDDNVRVVLGGGLALWLVGLV
jgi:dolichol kinase